MIGGIGNVLLSRPILKLKLSEGPLVSVVNL